MVTRSVSGLIQPLWRCLLVITLLGLPGGFGGTGQALDSQISLEVDTQVDSNDLAYQVCSSQPDDCSLRGAITRANQNAASEYII